MQQSSSLIRLQIRRPDDWHVHLREGDMMHLVLPYTSGVFGRAVVMPNLADPVDTVQKALLYKKQILNSVPKEHTFEPLMTLYLTEETSVHEIVHAKKEGLFGVKYYPKGATTASTKGIASPEVIYPVLEVMEEQQLPLLVHAEVPSKEVDVYDLEARFWRLL